MSAIHTGLAQASGAAADSVVVNGDPSDPDCVLWTTNGADGEGHESEMPRTLGGVRIAHQIGEGGMGRVYLGHHPVLDVDVAVKVMHANRADRARFLTEARLAAKVHHENIVRILHAGDERGYRFLVMEFVSGSNLKQVVAERGRIPWRQAAGYILQAASGLAAAHRQGIVHRDVKPSNLLLSEQDRVKVADLGVARTLLGEGDGTATDSIIGTPAYMAPEQARDPHAVTPAADVYGLGASFYFLLTGEVPFPGLSFADLVVAHRTGSLPDPRRLIPDVPASMVGLMHRLMAKDPWTRPADGAEVVHEFERALGLATVSTAVPFPQSHAPVGRRWWLAAAAGLALGGFLLLGSAMPDRADPPPIAAQQDPAPQPVPVAAAPGAAVVQGDAWQTPPRAVFVLADRLPVVAVSGIEAACAASGLPLVERQRIDVLVREQDLLSGGRIDPATAGRLGRLVGGHLALFAAAIEDRIEIRIVEVETGELAVCRLVAVDQVEAVVTAALTAVAAQLPIHARISAVPAGFQVSAGTRHGLRVGDRLELRRSATDPVLTIATVTAVEAGCATCVVQGAGTDCDGALATRMAP
jgi:hypothetical protein